VRHASAVTSFATAAVSSKRPRPVQAGPRVFDLAAMAVFVSIVAHGLTEIAGERWIVRRAQPQDG
jgi:hypothetical protein